AIFEAQALAQRDLAPIPTRAVEREPSRPRRQQTQKQFEQSAHIFGTRTFEDPSEQALVRLRGEKNKNLVQHGGGGEVELELPRITPMPNLRLGAVDLRGQPVVARLNFGVEEDLLDHHALRKQITRVELAVAAALAQTFRALAAPIIREVVFVAVERALEPL